ncbi:TPA: hypothetical protein NHK44_005874 [Pseudomonas aeruginosa]|nr:hypothetical protein [Pseudomonas aeruginosa]
MKKWMVAAAFSSGLVLAPGAFAVNTEAGIAELVKKCERRASPGMCACVPKEMHRAGFSYEEILMFSNPGYKAVTPAEIERHMDYGMKLKLVAVPACHNK